MYPLRAQLNLKCVPEPFPGLASVHIPFFHQILQSDASSGKRDPEPVWKRAIPSDAHLWCG